MNVSLEYLLEKLGGVDAESFAVKTKSSSFNYMNKASKGLIKKK